jgi:branched-chain amino acid transport system substrate-binding protein
MAPSLFAYPDDPRPAVKAFMQKYKAKYGVEANYLGQMGYTSAQIAIEALQRAGRELTVDSLVKAMESIQDYHDLFGGTYSFSATNHHGATAAFLSVVHNGRWEPVVDRALAY